MQVHGVPSSGITVSLLVTVTLFYLGCGSREFPFVEKGNYLLEYSWRGDGR
jgi:hypothetical protein